MVNWGRVTLLRPTQSLLSSPGYATATSHAIAVRHRPGQRALTVAFIATVAVPETQL